MNDRFSIVMVHQMVVALIAANVYEVYRAVQTVAIVDQDKTGKTTTIYHTKTAITAASTITETCENRHAGATTVRNRLLPKKIGIQRIHRKNRHHETKRMQTIRINQTVRHQPVMYKTAIYTNQVSSRRTKQIKTTQMSRRISPVQVERRVQHRRMSGALNQIKVTQHHYMMNPLKHQQPRKMKTKRFQVITKQHLALTTKS